jgi:hypothetical protein
VAITFFGGLIGNAGVFTVSVWISLFRDLETYGKPRVPTGVRDSRHNLLHGYPEGVAIVF